MEQQIEYLKARFSNGRLSRREFIGKLGALGVAAATANVMLSEAARAAGPVKGGTLKLGMNGGASTDTLDPGLMASQAMQAVGRFWGNRLVGVSADGDIEMKLAESIESTPDAKTWRFTMRRGVEYHNGRTVTAEDALKTIQRHSDSESKSGALGLVKGIESMKVDGDVFELTLEQPNSDLPFLMADYHLLIQPDGGFEDPNAGIGTGPYTVDVYEPGTRHRFKKFANHWEEGIGHADEVEVLILNDATARMAALQSGQVHMVNGVDPKIANLLNRTPNIDIRNIAGRAHYAFLMHCDTAPFDNNDLRMALKLAVNRREMVDKILRGYGSIGNDMPINGAYPLFDNTIEQREYDPEMAAEYYEKSGHDGSPIVMLVADTAFPGAVDAASLFSESALEAGIPLEIKRVPNDGYWSEVWNAKPFCASYWGGRNVQDQMYTTAYLSTADWNDTRFKRPEFDEMLIEARAELDTAKKKEIYSQMGRMVRNEGGIILPMFNDVIDAVSDKVGGFEPNPNGELMANFAGSRCWLK